MPERFADYLTTAAEQIRWKRAREPLLEELQTHLLEQMDACMAAGMDATSAQEEAVRQMGDPVIVGAELDRVHHPESQWKALTVMILFAVGVTVLRLWLMGQMADVADPYGWYGTAQPIKTVLALPASILALLAGYFLDVSFLGRHGKAIYALFLTGGLLALWLSPRVNGCSYYASFGVWCYPMVYALWVYTLRGKEEAGYAQAVLGWFPLAAVGLAAPNLAAVLILMVSGVILLFVVSLQDWFGMGRRAGVEVTVCLTILVTLAAALMVAGGYGAVRIRLALHPEEDPQGYGYMAMMLAQVQSHVRILGQGSWDLAEPFARTLPEWASDFWLNTIAYRLGWLPAALIVAAMVLLLTWLLVCCLRKKNRLGQLVSATVVLTFGMQVLGAVVLNLGFVLFSVPMPMLAGRLFLIQNMALLGVTLSAFRQEKLPERILRKKQPRFYPHSPFVSWQDGDLVIALGRRT